MPLLCIFITCVFSYLRDIHFVWKFAYSCTYLVCIFWICCITSCNLQYNTVYSKPYFLIAHSLASKFLLVIQSSSLSGFLFPCECLTFTTFIALKQMLHFYTFIALNTLVDGSFISWWLARMHPPVTIQWQMGGGEV